MCQMPLTKKIKNIPACFVTFVTNCGVFFLNLGPNDNNINAEHPGKGRFQVVSICFQVCQDALSKPEFVMKPFDWYPQPKLTPFGSYVQAGLGLVSKGQYGPP